ncbi:redoxin domain-containing protein [Teredinibacter sp. KSP-S5-2]|uniref:redoxin domain-containing protein n=1 Tax=Teredinibacter sp. KSP-S5-2 TaxID=3034506 RepID=UPI002934E130|nr:redoxin domain-containing protein [Teredinibacter sp. KSP-S5-2]WNO08575.1 redoxin domain-containing protein [Teredinibacter sp. KSP-S5-2]
MQPLIHTYAPELQVSNWVNTEKELSIQEHRGKVIVIYAFQMLCPGCISYCIPQAKKMSQLFSSEEILLIGLHSVFEHHDVMGIDALNVFIHEYKLAFPVAVDQASTDSTIPQTMSAYRLNGTPSLIIIDKQGLIRVNQLGHVDDMLVGKILGQLMSE